MSEAEIPTTSGQAFEIMIRTRDELLGVADDLRRAVKVFITHTGVDEGDLDQNNLSLSELVKLVKYYEAIRG